MEDVKTLTDEDISAITAAVKQGVLEAIKELSCKKASADILSGVIYQDEQE